MRREHPAIAEALFPYYQDVYDHVLRVSESTDALRDLVGTIVDANLALRDYRTNQIMKKVTSWAAIIAVPTLITGYYGMNVPYPTSGQSSGVYVSLGLMAAMSGGLESPIWLLLYPHVVGVSVRGGLRYAMTLGTLDALLVYWLALLSPSHALGELNGPAILFCAFMGGSTSSFLHGIRARLAEANRALQAKNEELASTVGQVREANGRLEDLQRLRYEYLRNVSHEFRSPLTVIRGYAEFVRDQGVPPDSSLPDVMRVMLDSCDQMIDMVDTLLEVSRIEQGETGRRLDTRSVAIGEILETALASVRGLADKKDATIDIALPAQPLEIVGDPSLLAHALRHLLSNALKYGPARGIVSIRGQVNEASALLEVEDQGIGISAEHLPHIFEKFYVADGGLDRRRGGAGVGLYLAREIVRLHHGTIEVKSQPGRGSIFSVTLPRRKSAAAGEATA
jgi:signal transduction histidine kinase